MAAPCGHCGQFHEAFMTTCPATGARLAGGTYTLVSSDELLVGNVIGERYHVRDILGQGSTGTVFGTVHAHFNRLGAMKVLRPRFTSLDTLQRVFHGDARAAFSVVHPSLCEVYDIGSLPDGAPFFVMEKLEGDSLASRLGRERFSTAAAVDLLMQLLSVMEAVHARELLFRDLRPQNIFLAHRRGCRPVLKVLDFGLSRLVPLEKVQVQWDALRAVAADDDQTGALSVPYYLSPERIRSEQGLEPTNDLFAAAIIFYEALTGQRPFTGSTWSELVADIAQGQPIPISVLRPDLPDELAALVMRSLSSKPRARPGSAREMQDELRAIFEERKRGSTSMRSATVATATEAAAPSSRSHVEPSRDNLTPYVGLPVSSRTLHTAAPAPRDDAFEDETRTDRKKFEVPERFEEPTRAVPSPAVDEASADHPIRTVRPPAGVDIDIDVDLEPESHTSRGDALTAILGAAANQPNQDEETATMQLTPELRARIEQMSRPGTPAVPVDDSRPPPTRRMGKPPSSGR
jgi:serine/threonine-protein kinase